MFTVRSYASLFVLALCCSCYLASNQRKVTFDHDDHDDNDTEDYTPSTDYRVHCKDHRKNQDETDVDCGGNKCPRCANTKSCKNKCDCISGVCENNKCGDGCVPACKNNGKCIGKNKCSCPDGFQGPTCEIQSGGLCSAKDLSARDPILSITFGNGPEQYSRKTPKDLGFTTTYKQQFQPVTLDGYFSLINSIHDDFGGSWHTGGKDHTGDEGGYMFLVDADFQVGELYRGTVKNLCVGQRYEFSVYLANIHIPDAASIKPNIVFQVRNTVGNELLDEKSTGTLAEHNTLTWRKYGLTFTATSPSVVLLIISKAAGGSGNDFAIDDIALRVCGKGSGFCPADE